MGLQLLGDDVDDKEQKIEAIISFCREKIKNLILDKVSGRVELTLILDFSQGFIGSAHMQDNTKVCILKQGK
jgi:hypothetical protein